MTTIHFHATTLLSEQSHTVQAAAQAILELDAEKEKALAQGRREIEHLGKKLAKQSAAAKVLRSSNANLLRQVARRDAKIEKLQAKLAMMTKQAFGSKSDTLNLGAAPTEEEEAAALAKLNAQAEKNEKNTGKQAPKPKSDTPDRPDIKKKKKKKGKGRQKRKYGKNVEIEHIKHGPDTCPCGCGGGRREGKPVEELVTIPARQVLFLHHIPVYRCRCEGKLVPLAGAKRLLPGRSLGGSTIAYFVALKFDWFMPTYRQERILKQEGSFVHRSTISRNINALSERVLTHVADEIYQDLLSNSDVLHTDETTHHRLINGHGKVKKRSLMSIVRDERGWGGLRFPAAYYRMFPSNSQAAFAELFGGHTKIVTHDGHVAFNRFGEAGTTVENITGTGCWAHARRYFVDGHNIGKSKDARSIVTQIDRVFELERRIRGTSSRLRQRVRRRCSKPILAKLHHTLSRIINDYPQDNTMGRAIRYTLRRWGQLTAFLNDGRIEMHNNNVERAFKSPILLRNASLFSASDEGERAWAVCFTLSETCRMNGVNFYRYLLWVMEKVTRLGDDVDYRLLLPWNAPDHCHTAVEDTLEPTTLS